MRPVPVRRYQDHSTFVPSRRELVDAVRVLAEASPPLGWPGPFKLGFPSGHLGLDVELALWIRDLDTGCVELQHCPLGDLVRDSVPIPCLFDPHTQSQVHFRGSESPHENDWLGVHLHAKYFRGSLPKEQLRFFDI